MPEHHGKTTMDEERIFTLSEASHLIPQLRTILVEASEEFAEMRRLNPQIQKVRDKVPLDGFSPEGVPYVEAATHLLYLLHQVKEMGVYIKDIDKGLCDFPYMRHGRVVYLCWHLGEDTITHWHDIESGFGGREPLDETDR
jgi:hypothetical protein